MWSIRYIFSYLLFDRDPLVTMVPLVVMDPPVLR